MIRTQIQISAEQAAALRAMSAERRQPIAELIRAGIDSFLRNEAGMSREQKRARARSAAGRFASSHTDVSEAHDRYLEEAFRQQ